MPGPRGALSVRINDGVSDRHYTDQVRDLQFRKTAPGGFADASMRLLLPRNTFRDLGPADKVYIYDRYGHTLWEGFTDNPGTSDGTDGQGFNLSAMGTTVLASDTSQALIYIDRDVSQWVDFMGGNGAVNATRGPADDPAGVVGSGILTQLQPGQPVSTNTHATARYLGLEAAGMQLGGMQATVSAGKTDTNYLARLAWGTGGGALQNSVQIQTTPVTSSRWAGGGGSFDPPAGVSFVALQLVRTGGATNVSDDTTWAFFYSVSILGRRMDRTGTLLTGSTAHGGTATYVLASWVVEDLLGRVLTFADKGLSRVDTTTWQIDQLAYPDGTRAANLLDDLSVWEPDFLWEILHSTPNGYVFNYRAWPTDARYEISTEDGYNAPGADIDLCNRIAVYWNDARGNKQVTVSTTTVPALGSRVRDAEPITLPDGQGSLANAQRIGAQELATKANPPAAASAVVDRPILDRLTGNMVFPWEIEPGYLVRVRETGDLLRMTEMNYSDNDMASTLTLGEPVLTVEQRIARLENAKVA